MKYANLLVGGACLLLLQLEMGAARATNSRPSESLYATARELGLDAAGLDEIWRTGQPLVRTQNEPNRVTTVTYALSPDKSTIKHSWRSSYHGVLRENCCQPLHPISEPESILAGFFLNPFLNPFGSGFAQSFFESWALPKALYGSSVTTTTSTYSTSSHSDPGASVPGRDPLDEIFAGFPGTPGSFNPDNQPQSPPFNGNPNNRNPNERNPNERNPNQRNPNQRNPNERNPNERYPNERNPNERYPNERNPNERNPNERNPNERNPNAPNDPQWIPVPEATTRRPAVPLPTLAPSNNGSADTVIDDFLAKVDVTTSDIKEEDGEYVRTIVDKNGRVLTAKFELVNTKSEGEK